MSVDTIVELVENRKTVAERLKRLQAMKQAGGSAGFQSSFSVQFSSSYGPSTSLYADDVVEVLELAILLAIRELKEIDRVLDKADKLMKHINFDEASVINVERGQGLLVSIAGSSMTDIEDDGPVKIIILHGCDTNEPTSV